MKRLILSLLVFLLLSACHKDETVEPTISTPLPDDIIIKGDEPPSTHVSASVTPPPVSTGGPPVSMLPLPAPSATSAPSQPLDSGGPLPQFTFEVQLGNLNGVCAGNDIYQAPNGRIYTTGWQRAQTDAPAEHACASMIDPTTDEVHTWDLAVAGPILAAGETLYTSGLTGAGGQFFTLVELVSGAVLVETPMPAAIHKVDLAAGHLWLLAEDILHVFSLDTGNLLDQVADVQAFAFQDELLALAGLTPDGRLFVGLYDQQPPLAAPLRYRDDLGEGREVLQLTLDAPANRLYLVRRLSDDSGATRWALDLLDLTDLSTLASHELNNAGELLPDPARGRLYVAGDPVLAYDSATGLALTAVFSIPPGQPEGFVVNSQLRLDAASGRLYQSYEGFDGDQWLLIADPGSGAQTTDVPIPPGPWTLVNGQVLAGDQQTLLLLDHTGSVARRLSLSDHPSSAVPGPSGVRLFVTDVGGDLHILDPLNLQETGLLPGVGRYISLDPNLMRLYVGDRYSGGINVYYLNMAVGAALVGTNGIALVGQIPQPGKPVASPADGLVYILEEDVYRANGETLELFTRRTTRNDGCNGCEFPTDLLVDPNSSLYITTTYSVRVGKPGRSQQAALDPETGRAFVAVTSGGYQVTHSLLAFPDLRLEQPERWIDGLYGDLSYNPASEQLYVISGQRWLVLDGPSLELLGSLELAGESHVLAIEPGLGRVYLASSGPGQGRGGAVQVFEPGGGALDAPLLEALAALPGPVSAIVPSPRFAQDRMLFALAYQREPFANYLYRSTDGGASWQQIGGGLPDTPSDLLFAADGALYAALGVTTWRSWPQSAAWGQGVYRSDDGGDTWQPDNAGLTHLRVTRLHQGDDGKLYALSASAVEPGYETSGPTVWARAPGAAWQPVEIAAAGPLRLLDYNLPYTYTQQVAAWWHSLDGAPLYQGVAGDLERSDDNGLNWQVVGAAPSDYALDVQPGLDGQSVYWLGPEFLWRSPDGGASWSALQHPALADDVAMTFALYNVGGETLFIGAEGGQVIVVPLAEALWE